MNEESSDAIDRILDEVQVPLDHPQFYSRLFTAVINHRKRQMANDGNNFKRLLCEEYNKLSQRLDRTQIQDSTAVRNVLKTRRLANLLINDKGELNISSLPALIEMHKKCLYSLGPDRQYDAYRQEHILKVLQLLNDRKELQRQLKLISRPYSHKQAEQMIRDTLQLPPNTSITDAHTRRAVLSAWLCYLRQNVGSCFATAPAIIVHDELPEQFLKDLAEMLNTGRMKRTFGGIEYSVPMSISSGSGDLRKLVRMPRTLVPGAPELWQSPGIMYALEAAGLIDAEMPLRQKIIELKRMIQKALKTYPKPGDAFAISPEDLLSEILLQHLELSRQDIEDYLNRPQGMIHSGLLMQVQTASAKNGNKGETCAHYLQLFEIAKSGFKSLAENALLKAWEFTLASFAETKADFAKWNLYSSLGLRPDDKHGIGPAMIEVIQAKLNDANAKVEEIQSEYEQVYTQVKYLESRIRQASTEKELVWLKAEYQSRGQEFYTLQEIRDKNHNRAKRFAGLYDVLIDIYYNLFPNYFQEVFDADMRDVAVGQYDDSPAGFRLLYKHGRSNTSLWSRIYTPSEFIQALSSFFIVSENEVAADPRLEGLQEDISAIITRIVTQIKTDEFLESAFTRMASAHQGRMVKNPLENLDKIDKKPWAYTSGGSMATLVSCYFKREQKPTETARWVENELELLGFLVDSIRQIPYKITEEYITNPRKSMLMHSPTHAFMLKPGYPLMREGWQNEALSYIWARDQMLTPMQKFVSNLRYNDLQIASLLRIVCEELPHDFQARFKELTRSPPAQLSSSEFHNYLFSLIQHDPQLRTLTFILDIETLIDSTLYTHSPFTAPYHLRERVEAIFQAIPYIKNEEKVRLLKLFDRLSQRVSGNYVASAQQLQDICCALICLNSLCPTTQFDMHRLIAQAAQKLGFAMPTALNFADTNWNKEEFAFVVNPGTTKFELWCMDPIGTKGFPMFSWSQWLNGSRKDIPWGIYNRPNEYN
jgi:hypothetical protein